MFRFLQPLFRMPSQIAYTLIRPLYSPQRHIRQPILLTIVGHREAHAVQTRVVCDELAQRLRSEILLRLHLYRYYVRIVLHNEVNLQCRIVIAVIVDKGARQRLQLLQDIVLGESATKWLPRSLKQIGSETFSGCSALQSISLQCRGHAIAPRT